MQLKRRYDLIPNLVETAKGYMKSTNPAALRLTRAYLGASNFARHPDNFTNFDSHDNRYETEIARHDTPLHVINTALNTRFAHQQPCVAAAQS